MLRRIPVHPLLWSLWPAAALWSGNWRIVALGEVLPLVAALVALTPAVWVVSRLLGFPWQRGAIITSTLLVAGQLLGLVPARSVVVLSMMGLVTVGIVEVARRLGDEAVASVTFLLNAVGVIALSIALGPVILAALRAPETLVMPAPGLGERVSAPERDILYIVPDRFGRADVLQHRYDWDSAPFLNELKDRGFQIADRSTANYPKTSHSLAAAWNLDYLDEAVADLPNTVQPDLRILYPLLRDPIVGNIAIRLGYDYLHLGSYWAPTETAKTATEVLTMSAPSQFASVHTDRTILPALRDVLPGLAHRDFRALAREHVVHSLETLEAEGRRSAERPRLVVAHLTLPHEPYTFEPDGSFVPPDVEASRDLVENYTRQLSFTEAALLRIVDAWLDRPQAELPIIIIQADEGPHPQALLANPSGFVWVEAAEDDKREKLGILTALHLPGYDDEIPDTLSPVNTFRLVFDAYHDTGFGLLPDRSYIYTSESERYRFTEVTRTIQ
jgi:hypothetical protein